MEAFARDLSSIADASEEYKLEMQRLQEKTEELLKQKEERILEMQK